MCTCMRCHACSHSLQVQQHQQQQHTSNQLLTVTLGGASLGGAGAELAHRARGVGREWAGIRCAGAVRANGALASRSVHRAVLPLRGGQVRANTAAGRHKAVSLAGLQGAVARGVRRRAAGGALHARLHAGGARPPARRALVGALRRVAKASPVLAVLEGRGASCREGVLGAGLARRVDQAKRSVGDAIGIVWARSNRAELGEVLRVKGDAPACLNVAGLGRCGSNQAVVGRVGALIGLVGLDQDARASGQAGASSAEGNPARAVAIRALCQRPIVDGVVDVVARRHHCRAEQQGQKQQQQHARGVNNRTASFACLLVPPGLLVPPHSNPHSSLQHACSST